MDHKARASIMLEILQGAVRDLQSEHPAQREVARQIIDDYWHAAAADQEPMRAIVRALERARMFQHPANGTSMDSLLDKASASLPEEQRADAIKTALVETAMLCFPPTAIPPDREVLWRAIVAWPNVGSRERWPAVYALAESIGLKKKPETLQREIKRILGTR